MGPSSCHFTPSLSFLPVDEFRKLHISASDGNWPSAHPQVEICFSAWQEFKQVLKTNKGMAFKVKKEV